MTLGEEYMLGDFRRLRPQDVSEAFREIAQGDRRAEEKSVVAARNLLDQARCEFDVPERRFALARRPASRMCAVNAQISLPHAVVIE